MYYDILQILLSDILLELVRCVMHLAQHGGDLLDVVHAVVLVAVVVVKIVRQLLEVGGLLVDCRLDILGAFCVSA